MFTTNKKVIVLLLLMALVLGQVVIPSTVYAETKEYNPLDEESDVESEHFDETPEPTRTPETIAPKPSASTTYTSMHTPNHPNEYLKRWNKYYKDWVVYDYNGFGRIGTVLVDFLVDEGAENDYPSADSGYIDPETFPDTYPYTSPFKDNVLTIPSDITEIGYHCFDAVVGFDTTIVIPATVQKIDKAAFVGGFLCGFFEKTLLVFENSDCDIDDQAFYTGEVSENLKKDNYRSCTSYLQNIVVRAVRNSKVWKVAEKNRLALVEPMDNEPSLFTPTINVFAGSIGHTVVLHNNVAKGYNISDWTYYSEDTSRFVFMWETIAEYGTEEYRLREIWGSEWWESDQIWIQHGTGEIFVGSEVPLGKHIFHLKSKDGKYDFAITINVQKRTVKNVLNTLKTEYFFEDSGEFEKYMIISDWMQNNIFYYDAPKGSKNDPNRSVKATIKAGKCSCGGAAKLAVYLTKKLTKQPIRYATRTSFLYDANHAYNEVKYNGKWYVHDNTNIFAAGGQIVEVGKVWGYKPSGATYIPLHGTIEIYNKYGHRISLGKDTNNEFIRK